MVNRQSGSHLADQQFMWQPEASGGEDGSVDAVDMEIVAATYRSIVDQSAFEEMIRNWETKLETATKQPATTKLISRRLLDQLLTARDTLENLDIPAENDPLRKAISDVPGPAMVLSPDGRVAITNMEGERAFAVRQGAFLDKNIIDPCSIDDFSALLRAAASNGNIAQAILTLHPAESFDNPSSSILAEAFLIRVQGQTGSHLAIRSLEIAWSAAVSVRLQEAFSLSAAEAEVARQFFQLRSIDRIADERGVSRLTVRTQIKSIMNKTGSPTNVDLMRLLAMVANRALLGERGHAPVWHDPLGREQTISCPDGRIVAWTWMGAENGTPVVMSRGLPMTYLLPGDGEARLRDEGIKLYILSRPGYGNSTLHPELSVLDDNLAALRAFLDQVIDRPCLGVGLASGIVPLLVEQHANPARFHHLMIIGFSAGFDQSGIHRLPRIQRTMLQLATTAPWVVELMAKTAHRMLRQHGLDWYLERAFKQTPLNQKTLSNPDWTVLIRNACEHALKQGHVAFVRELQLVRQNVDDSIRDLSVPLLYLAPAEDDAIDLNRIARWQTVNRNISVETVSDAAELVFYQQPDLILDRIIAAAHKKKTDTPFGV